MLRAVLDLGSDPKEYGRQYEAQLRSAELESIQDYIAESDNLVALHGQVLFSGARLLFDVLQYFQMSHSSPPPDNIVFFFWGKGAFSMPLSPWSLTHNS